MLTIILLALGGAAAITAIALARGGSASASASPSPTTDRPLVVAAPMEFEPEVVTHSPEWKARQAAAVTASQARVFFVGDSLTTSGYWKSMTIPGATLDGKGWKSQQIVAVAKQAVPLVKKFAPTSVVFLAGANDVVADHPLERIERDYAAAWKMLRDSTPGVWIWAVLLTPWAGHKKSSATRQVVTREVNGWVRAQRGQPGGVDEIVDPAELGDADGRLLATYSGDGLHMKAAGYKALGAVVERALRGGMMAQANVGAGVLTVGMFDAVTVGAMVEAYDASVGDDTVDVGAEAFNEPQVPGVDIGPGLPKWPVKWRKPTAEILKAVAEASKKYEVPEDVILAVIRKESNFDPRLSGYRALKASYARNKDIKIPGSSITWGAKFEEDGWKALGVCQVLPFNLFGVKGLLKASDPISAAFNVRINILAGARVLKILYDKFGTWEDSVWKYNGSRAYQREVFAFLETFRAAQVA